MLKQPKIAELTSRLRAAEQRRMQLTVMKQSGYVLEAGHDWINGEIAQITADIKNIQTQKSQFWASHSAMRFKWYSHKLGLTGDAKEIGRKVKCSGPLCIQRIIGGEERFSHQGKRFCSRGCMEAYFLGIEKDRARNAVSI